MPRAAFCGLPHSEREVYFVNASATGQYGDGSRREAQSSGDPERDLSLKETCVVSDFRDIALYHVSTFNLWPLAKYPARKVVVTQSGLNHETNQHRKSQSSNFSWHVGCVNCGRLAARVRLRISDRRKSSRRHISIRRNATDGTFALRWMDQARRSRR